MIGMILGVFFTGSLAAAKTYSVKMESISYQPKLIEAKAGDQVEWQNVAQTEHSATSDDTGVFDTGLVAVGAKSKVIKMDKVGSFKYHCQIHGKTMHGEVRVSR